MAGSCAAALAEPAAGAALLADLAGRLPGLALSTEHLDLYATDVSYRTETPPLAVARPTEEARSRRWSTPAAGSGFRSTPAVAACPTAPATCRSAATASRWTCRR